MSLHISIDDKQIGYRTKMISQSKLLIVTILVVLLIASVYAHVGLENAYAMKKGSHHSEASKKKISESLKKYHATGKTKKQRGEG